jgi:hypothetical protein
VKPLRFSAVFVAATYYLLSGQVVCAQTNQRLATVLTSGVWAYLDAEGNAVVSGSFLGVPPKETLTAAAQSYRDEFDFRTGDPVLGCGEPGMPRALTAGSPMEFGWDGDTLTIRYESMDVRRRISIGDRATDQANEGTANNGSANSASANGVSVGRWEGDALVIETTGLDDRVIDLLGTPKTAGMRIIERYTIEPVGDSTMLKTELRLIDPAVFVEPYDWNFNFKLIPDWELLVYACEERPEALTPGVVPN